MSRLLFGLKVARDAVAIGVILGIAFASPWILTAFVRALS